MAYASATMNPSFLEFVPRFPVFRDEPFFGSGSDADSTRDGGHNRELHRILEEEIISPST